MTILFCDVVGSTVARRATDPETTRRVMSRYSDAMRVVVTPHGGTVERFRGDEVMAVFGVPTVHEDDALRAVRAGKAMQRRLAELNEELVATWGVQLKCRIGINTGEVVAGDPGTGETFVTGDAVNVAKRLEQAAQPGEILIGTATYPLVKDASRFGPRYRFSAKGKREPVVPFRLDDVDATAEGYARRLDAPLVGRRAELDRLRELVLEGLAGEHARIVRRRRRGRASASRASFERSPIGERRGGRRHRPLPLVRQRHHVLAARGARRRPRRHRYPRCRASAGYEDAEIVLDRVRAAIGTGEGGVPSDEVFWAVRRAPRAAGRATAAARLPRGRPLGRAHDARPRRVPGRVRLRAARPALHRPRRSCSSAGPASSAVQLL